MLTQSNEEIDMINDCSVNHSSSHSNSHSFHIRRKDIAQFTKNYSLKHIHQLSKATLLSKKKRKSSKKKANKSFDNNEECQVVIKLFFGFFFVLFEFHILVHSF
jgi:hypothetical protein